ncbi:MAG: ExbD/TolR family protein [Terrimicrobiaceae bacterium]
MRFHTRKRRTPSIIIVSLIDILAILLIFFIVTTTFRKDQPRLQINLPESTTAENVASEDKEPILLRIKSAEEITLDNQPIALESIGQAIQAARTSQPNRGVAMQADRDAPFGVVVKALDALKQAGIKNIPTFTQPDAAKP